MKLQVGFKTILVFLLFAGVLGLVTIHFSKGHGKKEEAEKHESSEKSDEKGERVVEIKPEIQEKSGILVQELGSASHVEEIEVQGVVIEREDLVELQKRDVSRAKYESVSENGPLIQIAMPAELSSVPAPQVIWIKNVDGTFFQAKQVFSFPSMDSIGGGLNFVYAASSDVSEIPSGTIVFAKVPVGSRRSGVFIPSPAVVLWQGKSWVYVEKDSGHFVRHEIPTDKRLEDGWFVSRGLSSKDRIVVQGAQFLLSEEARSEIPEEQ